jgi:uncharacterized protein (AIM24 family)
MANRIQLRRDTTANWENTDPVLADGEPGYDINTNEVRVGDGSTAWTDLSGNVIGTGGGGGASTGNVTFNDFTIIGTGNIHLQPDDQDSSYLDVFLTGGADVHVTTGAGHLILGGDNAANVSVRNDGNVQIQSYGAYAKTWTFDTEGVLTLPVSTSNVMIDATTVGTQTIAQNGTVTFSSFSGEILVNATDTGEVHKYLVGSGKVWIMGSTSSSWTPSAVAPTTYAEITATANIAFIDTISSYVFTNLSSSNTNFNIVAIKTRNHS